MAKELAVDCPKIAELFWFDAVVACIVAYGVVEDVLAADIATPLVECTICIAGLLLIEELILTGALATVLITELVTGSLQSYASCREIHESPPPAGVCHVALPFASDVNTFPAPGVPAPEKRTDPATCNCALGEFVPMPTLPVYVTRNLSILFVLTIRG